MNNADIEIKKPRLWPGRLAQLLFWSWNAFFFSVSAFGILPLMLSAPLDTWQRALSIELLVRSLGLLLLPAVCMLTGYRYLRAQPTKLLQLFYGVEAPLLILLAARTFGLDEWSRGGWHVLISGTIATAALALQLCRGLPTNKRALHVLLAARTVGALLALWMAALVAVFFVPPVLQTLFAAGFWRSFFRALPVIPLIAPFMLYTATLLVGAPLGLSWAHLAGALRLARFHRLRARLTYPIAAATALGFGATAFICNRQPAITERTTDKATLLNAYLAPDRYLMQRTDIWIKDTLAAPFVYNGTFGDDQVKAKTLYEQIYDAPIGKAERASIAAVKAHERLWSWNRESNVLDIDAKRVRLARQQVSIHERGDFAEIEIHDLYENETANDQEIFYYFTLPEDAAVTGLWLGANDNRNERWAGVLAPRGAAQAVYRGEVRKSFDPALVEQLGPTQYRLRAYPVPLNGHLHLWMTYTAAREGADWPRPRVLEKRNAYWNDATQYLRYGEAVVRSESDAWVPNEIPAGARIGDEVQTTVLPDKTVVSRERFDARPSSLPHDKRLLLVVDGSYSMAAHHQAVSAALDWARSNLAIANQVDVALRTTIKPIGEVHDGDITAQGHDTLATVLAQAKGSYDAWFVLTDATGNEGDAPASAPALWLVTFGDLPAQQYTDATQKLLARRGSGAAPTLERASYRMAAMFGDPSILTVTDTSIWRQHPGHAAAPDVITPLGRVAIKHVVAGRDDLRAAHALATLGNVVTPVSSLIVLIDERQREALRQASAASDAFQRENETGLPQGNFNVTATPEPETWALLILALAAVLLSVMRTKATARLS